MYINGSSTSQTLAAASAKAKLNPTGAWTANGSQAVTIDATNGQITVLQGGVYQLDFWIVFEWKTCLYCNYGHNSNFFFG